MPLAKPLVKGLQHRAGHDNNSAPARIFDAGSLVPIGKKTRHRRLALVVSIRLHLSSPATAPLFEVVGIDTGYEVWLAFWQVFSGRDNRRER